MEKLEENHKILEEMRETLNYEKAKIQGDLDFHQSLTQHIMDYTPDMVWLKDLEGKYIVANNTIKKDLLFDEIAIGKDDIEMSLKAKEQFGYANHTFGEKCHNSDKVVIEELRPMRFLESGKIKGKMVYLEVYKFPFYVNDELIGTAGIGRDLTEYVEAYRDNECSKCPSMRGIFSKYEFKG
jgi:transcriptional regulator with PAS, ATPase and Fis domain